MLKMIFLGNDKRSKKATELIKERFNDIEISIFENLNQINEIYDIYIMPIPLSINGKSLNNSDVNIAVEKIINNIPENAIKLSAGNYLKNSIDIVSRDDFSYKNAVPTAEGAIALAMNHTEITLEESKVLVTGFGRVSKILIQKLKALCKDITVALRNKSDMVLIDTLGIKVIPIEKVAVNIKKFDIVFNSIPYKIFDRDTLSIADKKTLFIELSSNQLGFDTTAINEFDINYINAPGLPSKVAPITASKILADTIINILEEENII